MNSESRFLKVGSDIIPGLKLSSARDLFFLRIKVEGLSPQTARNYDYILGCFYKWFRENHDIDMPVQEIGTHILRQYFYMLQEKNLRKATIATHHRNLKAFLNFLVREGYLDDNPINRIAAPKLPRQFPYLLEDHQVKALLKIPDTNKYTGLRNYVMLLTFLDTGIRLSELAGLTLKDVNLSIRGLKVTGKGDKTREVFMGKKLVKAMHRWIQRRGYTLYEDALFTSRKGHGLCPDYIEHLVNDFGKKAGLKGVRCSPHTMRHTFATNYIRNGGDPFSLQQLLGHSDIKTVMIYVHMAGTTLREAHAKYSPIDRME